MGQALWEPRAEQMVDQSFIRWMHDQEMHQRLLNYIDWENYYDGEQKDTMNPTIKKALDSDYATISNFCKPVVEAPVWFIAGGEQFCTLDTSLNNQKTPEAYMGEAILTDVYERNGLLDTEGTNLTRLQAMKGDVFLKLYLIYDENENPVDMGISIIRPDRVFPKYSDSNYRQMLACCVKNYVIGDDGTRYWEAEVWWPDVVQVFRLGQDRPDLGGEREYPKRDSMGDPVARAKETKHEQWYLMEEYQNPFGMIPIFHIKNNSRDLAYGISDLQPMEDLQDSLNKSLTDLMYTMDEQAFQRIFLFGGGNGKPYYMSPGMVIELPNELGGIQTIPPVSPAGFLYTIDSLIDQISGVTSVPRQFFVNDRGIPASGYAVSLHYSGLRQKCNEKKHHIRAALRDMNWLILALAESFGWVPENSMAGLKTKIHFPGGLPKDEMMNTQLLMYQIQMGLKSRLTAMEEIGIENLAEEIARINAEQGALGQEAEASAE